MGHRCAGNCEKILSGQRTNVPNDGVVRLYRDRKGRGGKTVTLIAGSFVASLAMSLSFCGTEMWSPASKPSSCLPWAPGCFLSLSGFRQWPVDIQPSFPEANNRGWRWRERWQLSHLSSCWMSLSLLLIAIYVLVGLIFSTFAKSSGTAILFGVMVWLLFNLLYPILVFILGGILFGNDPASYFRFQQVAGLGSPTQVYLLLIQLASPQNLVGAGGTAIDPILPESAAVFWVGFLLFSALWTFHRRGAE